MWCDGDCSNCYKNTTTVTNKTDFEITRVVDISTDSINAIADAVVRKLKEEKDENAGCD